MLASWLVVFIAERSISTYCNPVLGASPVVCGFSVSPVTLTEKPLSRKAVPRGIAVAESGAVVVGGLVVAVCP